MQTETTLTKEELVLEIKKYMPVDNNKINWGDLCYFTKFDSFTTSFALGMSWIENIDEAPIENLKIALFNLIEFPNTDENSNSKKAGYGKTQQRIEFLKNYVYAENNFNKHLHI